jgi:hypothetical protein
MPPAFAAQFGVDPRRSIYPAAGGKDPPDMPTQFYFCLGPALNRGDRLQPDIEAADTDADDTAQRRHGMVHPFRQYERKPAHAIPLAKKAAAFRRIWFSSSSRLFSRFRRCISASSALR